MHCQSYFKYWGKSDKEGSYHLLPYHCLDVAAVANSLLIQNPIYLNHFLRLTNLKREEFLPWFTFLVALHDIGKFAECFQNLKPSLLKNLQQKSSNRIYGERHDSLGWLLWKKHIREQFISKGYIQVSSSKREKSTEQSIDLWMAAMLGHHGQPPKPYLEHPTSCFFDVEQDFTAASEFLEDVASLFLEKKLTFPKCDIKIIKLVSWWLSGLAVLCDWLGSNIRFFPYESQKISLDVYWDNAKQRSEIALNETEMLAGLPSLQLGLSDLLNISSDTQVVPTPLQLKAINWSFSDSPHLFILEDVTGAGKTEAAVLLSHRLMQAEQGNSVYFALPTMATANTMYARMKDVYRKLFSIDTIPSLVLAHGASDMSEDFRQSVFPDSKEDQNDYGDGTVSAAAHCNAWLADNRKKALLADIGIGTIDQALLAILPARHQSLRLLGLINKILIVDEVHACDSYMHELLCALLKAHAAVGGSAILLSATLPTKQRQALLNAYADGSSWNRQRVQKTDEKSYPLISCLNKEALTEDIVATRDIVKREVKIKFLSNQGAIETLIQQSLMGGQCIAWICNTVKDAIQTYQQIKNKYPDWNVDLFHARYALGDRIEIEQRVVKRFNKSSTEKERSGQLLIATQVVEQSLDLDFDFLITDLAPIDLIIQRAGRLRRHLRDKSGNPTKGLDQRGGVTLYIHSPEFKKNPKVGWYADFFPNAQVVYQHHGQLWLTAKILSENGKFKMPEDARHLIEGVYGMEEQYSIPESLLSHSFEAEGSSRASASIARKNALSIESGYSDSDSNGWWDEAKTPTRLGELTSTVYLAKLEAGQLLPWSDDKDYAWQMSAVSMRTYWIAEETIGDDISQEQIEQCKSNLPAKGKWGVLLPLTQGADGKWMGNALNENQEIVKVIYGKFGLVIDGHQGDKP